MLRTISAATTTGVGTAHLSNLLYPSKPRAHLLASSMLSGGTLRSVAAAAGMMTALGVSPAFAQCFSTATGLAGNCAAALITGLNATAIGFNSTATGIVATRRPCYGNGATANGDRRHRDRRVQHAIGALATATGFGRQRDRDAGDRDRGRDKAIGASATATG